MINKTEDGGLNLQNLECKLKSIKSNWITKLYNKEYKAPWKLNIEQYFKEDIEEIVKFNLASNDYSEFKDKFYIDMGKHGLNYHIKSCVVLRKYVINAYATTPELELTASP